MGYNSVADIIGLSSSFV